MDEPYTLHDVVKCNYASVLSYFQDEATSWPKMWPTGI